MVDLICEMEPHININAFTWLIKVDLTRSIVSSYPLETSEGLRGSYVLFSVENHQPYSSDPEKRKTFLVKAFLNYNLRQKPHERNFQGGRTQFSRVLLLM